LSNLENFKSFLDKIPADKIPADKMEQFKSIEVTADSIAFQGGPTGAVKFVVAEKREPSLIKLKAADLPLSLTLELHLKADGDNCRQQTIINADIPAMLKPMVAGPLQKVVDQFGSVLSAIPFND
jgi:hypothetical protein